MMQMYAIINKSIKMFKLLKLCSIKIQSYFFLIGFFFFFFSFSFNSTQNCRHVVMNIANLFQQNRVSIITLIDQCNINTIYLFSYVHCVSLQKLPTQSGSRKCIGGSFLIFMNSAFQMSNVFVAMLGTILFAHFIPGPIFIQLYWYFAIFIIAAELCV